jgi:hypothetical protein
VLVRTLDRLDFKASTEELDWLFLFIGYANVVGKLVLVNGISMVPLNIRQRDRDADPISHNVRRPIQWPLEYTTFHAAATVQKRPLLDQ